MKKATLRATASAFALLGAGFTTAAMVAAPAAAQDYTSAALSGNVQDEGGAAIAGATVQLVSLDLGFTRTATTDANGAFRYAAVPAGNYDLVVSRDGAEVYRAEALRLLASQNASVDVVIPGGGSADDVIVVQGTSLLNDFEGTTLGLNVDLEELVKRVPLGRDLTSVILLAPGTTQGDSSFGNLASIGGSSVAENAYYLNGLNITNFDNYLGSARVPFDFYRSVEVKSGGYPAEFGRATGGIVNAVTKSGSNDFFGGINIAWSPDWLRSTGTDLETCTTAGCEFRTDRDADYSEAYSVVVEAGMPIIRDRLFVYGLLEMRDSEVYTINTITGEANRSVQDDPFWGFKVDAYPLDNHHLEFTMFDTSREQVNSVAPYSSTGDGFTIGSFEDSSKSNFGGVSFVGKYTGTLSDFLTVSAAYGKMRDEFAGVALDSGAFFIHSQSLATSPIFGETLGGRYTTQTAASVSAPYQTEREFYRGDVDLFFNLFGDHHIRAGFDVENNNLLKATVRTGGQFLVDNGYITAAAFNANNANAGVAYLIQEPTETTSGLPYEVELNYFNSGGSFDSSNRAFYIQDEWDVTDRLTLNLGLRRDDFKVNKADGSLLVELKENYAPRLGFTYDLWSEQQGKVFGYFGQYYLPIASNTAFRQAGSEYFFRERFELLGLDSNNLPILGDQITTGQFIGACPFQLTPSSTGNNCAVTGDGSVPDTTQAIDAGLQATRESEYILGYEHDFGDFTVGLSYIHRNLDITAEDASIDTAILNYCNENGIANCESVWPGFHQYVILNPGQGITVNAFIEEGDGVPELVGQTLTFTADELGYPEAKRTYDALELQFNRPWDGRWSLGGSYTLSRSEGNSEGFVQSDFGQADAGITQDFDVVEFTEFAFGRLPNDRTHRIKMFGALEVFDGFTLGSNISIESPRPLSCFGFHPTAGIGNLYGAASHYCGLEPAPRGEGSKTDWTTNVDLSARYALDFGNDKAVAFTVNVFNVFNSQAVTNRNEFGDASRVTDNNGTPSRLDDFVTSVTANPNYDLPTGYQAPRSVRLGMNVSF